VNPRKKGKRNIFTIIVHGACHWLSGQARGFNSQGHEFISHPVDQCVCIGKSQPLWDRVVG
jgi:hypothetical protein